MLSAPYFSVGSVEVHHQLVLLVPVHAMHELYNNLVKPKHDSTMLLVPYSSKNSGAVATARLRTLLVYLPSVRSATRLLLKPPVAELTGRPPLRRHLEYPARR